MTWLQKTKLKKVECKRSHSKLQTTAEDSLMIGTTSQIGSHLVLLQDELGSRYTSHARTSQYIVMGLVQKALVQVLMILSGSANSV